jgi:hypothetical protein
MMSSPGLPRFPCRAPQDVNFLTPFLPDVYRCYPIDITISSLRYWSYH